MSKKKIRARCPSVSGKPFYPNKVGCPGCFGWCQHEYSVMDLGFGNEPCDGCCHCQHATLINERYFDMVEVTK